jgi:hypothetical protein
MPSFIHITFVVIVIYISNYVITYLNLVSLCFSRDNQTSNLIFLNVIKVFLFLLFLGILLEQLQNLGHCSGIYLFRMLVFREIATVVSMFATELHRNAQCSFSNVLPRLAADLHGREKRREVPSSPTKLR